MRYKILDSGCWQFLGPINSSGYGTISWRGRFESAHHISHFLFKGRRSKGHHIHHKCKNKACINPEHLESLSVREHNTAHRHSHCKYGHPLEGYNVYVTPENERQCRTCKVGRTREYRRRKRSNA